MDPSNQNQEMEVVPEENEEMEVVPEETVENLTKFWSPIWEENIQVPFDGTEKFLDLKLVTPYPEICMQATIAVHQWLRVEFGVTEKQVNLHSWMPIFALTAQEGFDLKRLTLWGKIISVYGLVSEQAFGEKLLLEPMLVLINSEEFSYNNLTNKQLAVYTVMLEARDFLARYNYPYNDFIELSRCMMKPNRVRIDLVFFILKKAAHLRGYEPNQLTNSLERIAAHFFWGMKAASLWASRRYLAMKDGRPKVEIDVQQLMDRKDSIYYYGRAAMCNETVEAFVKKPCFHLGMHFQYTPDTRFVQQFNDIGQARKDYVRMLERLVLASYHVSRCSSDMFRYVFCRDLDYDPEVKALMEAYV